MVRVTGGAVTEELDWITCDDCARSFETNDGRGMIAAIKGACPNCGGRFVLEDKPRRADADLIEAHQGERAQS